MAWRLLAVLLVLTGTARSAPIVAKCYDGSSSAMVRWPTRSATRLGICDLDHHLDGWCQYRVGLGATGRQDSGRFEVTLHAGRRKHVRYADTTAVVRRLAGPEPQPAAAAGGGQGGTPMILLSTAAAAERPGRLGGKLRS